VVIGSLMDTFFCVGWSRLDLVLADAAKDENTSR